MASGHCKGFQRINLNVLLVNTLTPLLCSTPVIRKMSADKLMLLLDTHSSGSKFGLIGI